MLIYLLFPLMALIIDYEVYRHFKAKGGTMIGFWLAVAGIGVLALGLPFLVATPTIIHAGQQISTNAGNIIIPSYNETNSLNNSTNSYALLLGELLIFIQLGYALLMLLHIFVQRKRKQYE